MSRPIAILLTLAGFVTASEAHAQHFFRRGHTQPTATYQPSKAAGPGATTQPARTYSYSYYSGSKLPPRTYVGYGTEDFAYHGAPYGHIYDAWTWAYMSGSYSNGLARYYSPPVK